MVLWHRERNQEKQIQEGSLPSTTCLKVGPKFFQWERDPPSSRKTRLLGSAKKALYSGGLASGLSCKGPYLPFAPSSSSRFLTACPGTALRPQGPLLLPTAHLYRPLLRRCHLLIESLLNLGFSLLSFFEAPMHIKY